MLETVSPGRGACGVTSVDRRSGTVTEVTQPTDEQVYRTHADELVRFAMGLVGRSDAQDVVSEAVLRSWQSAGWSDVENKRAYLYRAVLNQARNRHRDRQRRWARELRAAHRSSTALPDCRPEVLEAVKALSVRQRAVVYLAYWADLANEDIATHLGISPGAVHRHLARARAKLRVMLDD